MYSLCKWTIKATVEGRHERGNGSTNRLFDLGKSWKTQLQELHGQRCKLGRPYGVVQVSLLLSWGTPHQVRPPSGPNPSSGGTSPLGWIPRPQSRRRDFHPREASVSGLWFFWPNCSREIWIPGVPADAWTIRNQVRLLHQTKVPSSYLTGRFIAFGVGHLPEGCVFKRLKSQKAKKSTISDTSERGPGSVTGKDFWKLFTCFGCPPSTFCVWFFNVIQVWIHMFSVPQYFRGFFPKGGGEVRITSDPLRFIRPVNITDAGRLTRITGRAFTAGVLPVKVRTCMRMLCVLPIGVRTSHFLTHLIMENICSLDCPEHGQGCARAAATTLHRCAYSHRCSQRKRHRCLWKWHRNHVGFFFFCDSIHHCQVESAHTTSLPDVTPLHRRQTCCQERSWLRTMPEPFWDATTSWCGCEENVQESFCLHSCLCNFSLATAWWQKQAQDVDWQDQLWEKKVSHTRTKVMFKFSVRLFQNRLVQVCVWDWGQGFVSNFQMLLALFPGFADFFFFFLIFN